MCQLFLLHPPLRSRIMSIQTPSESDPTDDDCLQKRAVTRGSLPLEAEEDIGDRFSMSSVSRCPKQEPSLGRLTSDSPSGEESKPCVLSLSQDSLSNMVLHTSPTLESIKELEEGEELSSGRRSPGDGKVRAKGGEANSDLPDFDLGERNLEAPDNPDSRDGELHGPVFVQTAETAGTSVNVLNLNEDALTDVTSLNRDFSEEKCPLECALKEEKSQEVSCPTVCGFQPGLVNRNTTEPNDHTETPDALDQDALRSSFVSLPKEQDLGAKPEDQRDLISVCSETVVNDTRNTEEGHLLSLLTRSGKNIDENQTQIVADAGADTSKDSLIEVLTACKSKVEQLELLEQSSRELTAQVGLFSLPTLIMHSSLSYTNWAISFCSSSRPRPWRWAFSAG